MPSVLADFYSPVEAPSLKRKRSFSDHAGTCPHTRLPFEGNWPMATGPGNTGRKAGFGHGDPWQAVNSTPRDLNSRTLKRFRDNRPDEGQIYENTLVKLYSAQRRRPAPTVADVHLTPVAVEHKPTPQPSLHAFWSLPQRSATIDHSVQQQGLPDSSICARCEDCDTTLGPSVDDAAMDIDDEVVDYACSECERIVCTTCTVNGGHQRLCLQCASRKRWVDGFGWV